MPPAASFDSYAYSPFDAHGLEGSKRESGDWFLGDFGASNLFGAKIRFCTDVTFLNCNLIAKTLLDGHMVHLCRHVHSAVDVSAVIVLYHAHALFG